jgi:hypothetical protein
MQGCDRLRRHPASQYQAETGEQRGQDEECLFHLMKETHDQLPRRRTTERFHSGD